ncbi:MAG TPA: class I SAM-dependent methyltransferase [Opitutaceae bacterium]|jgi:SAM-dependent methyltransferase
MHPSYYVKTYAAHLEALRQRHGEAEAMEQLVGGADHWVGMLEYGTLLNLGLQPDATIVDVGCGTGRFAHRLSEAAFAGRYVGTDILPDIVNYARQRIARADWTFAVAVAPPLPIEVGSADWVTFFSVFTHIADADIYLYLQEAKRLLKPGGRVVFSFLDFGLADHWPVFEQSLANRSEDGPLNRFLGKDTIRHWSDRLGLRIEAWHDGNEPWIKLSPPNVLHDLSAPFWQSIAVLRAS